jgi:hypothetical protein
LIAVLYGNNMILIDTYNIEILIEDNMDYKLKYVYYNYNYN